MGSSVVEASFVAVVMAAMLFALIRGWHSPEVVVRSRTDVDDYVNVCSRFSAVMLSFGGRTLASTLLGIAGKYNLD